MIAYDLDGVICPDVDMPWHDENFDFTELFTIRDKLPPIFYPKGEFYIITGRPIADKEHTEKWLYKFGITPRKIIYNTEEDPNLSHKIGEYKAKTFNAIDELKIFIESDERQVEVIKKIIHAHKKVYHFSEFISKGIHESCPRI